MYIHINIVATSSCAYGKTAFKEQYFDVFPKDLSLLIPEHSRAPDRMGPPVWALSLQVEAIPSW